MKFKTTPDDKPPTREELAQVTKEFLELGILRGTGRYKDGAEVLEITELGLRLAKQGGFDWTAFTKN